MLQGLGDGVLLNLPPPCSVTLQSFYRSVWLSIFIMTETLKKNRYPSLKILLFQPNISRKNLQKNVNFCYAHLTFACRMYWIFENTDFTLNIFETALTHLSFDPIYQKTLGSDFFFYYASFFKILLNGTKIMNG